MRRRVVLIVAVVIVGVAAIAASAIWLEVFGGRPTIQRTAAGTPSPAALCRATATSGASSAFVIDSSKSSASYEAHFQAEGQPLPGTVTGATGDVTGDVQFTTEPTPTITALRVTVDLRTLNSGAPERDNHIRADTFETGLYPFAVFTVSNASVGADASSNGQAVAFPLTGELTLHGVTRTVRFAMSGRLTTDSLTGSGAAPIHLQDFQMKPPETTSVFKITVNDDITLKVTFSATRTLCPPSS